MTYTITTGGLPGQVYLAPAGARPLACWTALVLAVLLRQNTIGTIMDVPSGTHQWLPDLGDDLAASPEGGMSIPCNLVPLPISIHTSHSNVFYHVLLLIPTVINIPCRLLIYSPSMWILCLTGCLFLILGTEHILWLLLVFHNLLTCLLSIPRTSHEFNLPCLLFLSSVARLNILK